MAQGDNLFTLDTVDTSLTSQTQAVQALRIATSDVSDQRLSAGLASFGAAIGQIGQRKKAEQQVEDVRTAKNAALRNEAMPGGLGKTAILAFQDTTDILTANKAKEDATAHFEGDAFASILNSPDLTSDQKNDYIQQTNSKFLLDASISIQNPNALLQYKQSLDALGIAATKSVFDVERTHIDTTGVQAMRSQIDEHRKAGFPITGKYVTNLAASFHKSSPWLDSDDTKLAALSLVLNSPDTTALEVTDIMKAEFSKGKNGNKGVSFGALASSQSTPAGKLILSRVKAFHDNRRIEKERARTDVIKAQIKINDDAIDTADEFRDTLLNDPNRSRTLTLKLQELGADDKTITSYLRHDAAIQSGLAQGIGSDDHQDGVTSVIEGGLTGRSAILEYVESHNLSNEARRDLLSLDTATKVEINKHVGTLMSDVATLNSAVTSGINKALSGNSTKLFMLSPQFDKLSEAAKTEALMNRGIPSAAFSDKIPALLALQATRTALRKEVLAEARLAVTEDRPPNSEAISNKFNARISKLISVLEGNAPSTKDAASGAVTKIEPPKTGGDPALKLIDKISKKEKLLVLDAASGNPEAQDSLFNSIIEAISVEARNKKTFTSKPFRIISDENSIKDTPPKAPPRDREFEKDIAKKLGFAEPLTEQQKQEDIIGGSSKLTAASKAQMIRSNPDAAARLNAKEVAAEVLATGKLSDPDFAIGSDLSLAPKDKESSEVTMWDSFKNMFSLGTLSDDLEKLNKSLTSVLEQPVGKGSFDGRIQTPQELRDQDAARAGGAIPAGSKSRKRNDGGMAGSRVPSLQEQQITNTADSFGNFKDNDVTPLGFIGGELGNDQAKINATEEVFNNFTPATAAKYGSLRYNASNKDEQTKWEFWAKKGIDAYNNEELTGDKKTNVDNLVAALDKHKQSYINDLNNIGMSYENFKQLMIGTYAAETTFGTLSDTSETKVVGPLQVTKKTFREQLDDNRHPFGPKVAKSMGYDRAKLKSLSNSDLTALLKENPEFNFMAGAMIMITKLQSRKLKL